MHPAIIGTVRSLIVDAAMGQIPRSTERISSFNYYLLREAGVNCGGVCLRVSVSVWCKN